MSDIFKSLNEKQKIDAIKRYVKKTSNNKMYNLVIPFIDITRPFIEIFPNVDTCEILKDTMKYWKTVDEYTKCTLYLSNNSFLDGVSCFITFKEQEMVFQEKTTYPDSKKIYTFFTPIPTTFNLIQDLKVEFDGPDEHYYITRNGIRYTGPIDVDFRHIYYLYVRKTSKEPINVTFSGVVTFYNIDVRRVSLDMDKD